ncbi:MULTISPECIES: alpha-hydroxy acid oxidase [unclassified Streptomyces]|uniref:alpha-hydroxy acid oxidase n=1 Tax=unclassified Streptomyces TaxID=2593676 RepID=UPI002E76F9F8|nr:alpha-hydroxy acid oxidase [Streptomyces sp. JV184]MEE1748348.1 alpha-hydroxy acid oxidase [Streptomyces sp. JV184]
MTTSSSYSSVPGPVREEDAARWQPEPACLQDLERAAAAVLPPDIWDFVTGGSGTESSLRANLASFEQLHLVPRVLRDVAGCSTVSPLLGREASAPLAIAPMAYHRLVHPDGELAVARAARDAGVPFVTGTLSSCPLEEIAAQAGRLWLQLYWLNDEARLFDLVDRAEAAGCEALMLTVDLPWMGRRLRDVRNRFTLPPEVQASHLGDGAASRAHAHRSRTSAVAEHTKAFMTASLSWEHIERLRERTGLRLVLKGVLDPGDARQAADRGIDAIVVSNHGGRQLDGAVPPMAVLPEIRDAVDGRCEILVDGGVRTGSDIVKAVALGASGALVGRPVFWGLATNGQAGVGDVLRMLTEELRDALGLAGCASVEAARSLRVVTSTPFRTVSAPRG